MAKIDDIRKFVEQAKTTHWFDLNLDEFTTEGPEWLAFLLEYHDAVQDEQRARDTVHLAHIESLKSQLAERRGLVRDLTTALENRNQELADAEKRGMELAAEIAESESFTWSGDAANAIRAEIAKVKP